MNILEIAQNRYTTKVYDPVKKIPKEQFEQLCEVLRLAPSSVNSQPWHFLVASSDEAKNKLLQGVAEFNRPRVRDASHVIVFCARTELDDAHLGNLLEQEAKDGRFADQKAKETTDGGRRYYVGLNSATSEQQLTWKSKQIYIALGTALFAAAALGINSTPIEGFDREKLDQALGLKEQGLTSVVIASFGYHADNDPNFGVPKSRLTEEQLFTTL